MCAPPAFTPRLRPILLQWQIKWVWFSCLCEREFQVQGHFRVCSVFSGILLRKLASDWLSDEIREGGKKWYNHCSWETLNREMVLFDQHSSEVCVCLCLKRRGVTPNWDKLELLEGLLLAGSPLKEQLVPALILWMDVAAAPGYHTDQSGDGTCSCWTQKCVIACALNHTLNLLFNWMHCN